jgi:LPXTG-motif cell wall-anchored protein
MPTPGRLARRLAAGCVLAASVALPGPATLASTDGSGVPAPASATPSAAPAVGSSSGQSPAVTSRGYAQSGPELHPDPPPNANTAPESGRTPKPPTVLGAPTQQEWEHLLDRLARHGVRPITDESGQVVLDSEYLLVLAGGAEGLTELRSWGAEITPEERPDVYAVRSGGRVVAWYLMEHRPVLTVVSPTSTPSPATSPGALATPSATPPGAPAGSLGPSGGEWASPYPGESSATSAVTTWPPQPQPRLPQTGSEVWNPILVALGGAGILCAGGLLVRLSRSPRRR